MSDKSTSSQDKVNSLAHLVQTTGNHLSHTHRHFLQLKQSVSGEAGKFNYEHAQTHLEGAIEHVQKIVDHLNTNYPKEAQELKELEQTVPRTDEKSRVVKKMAGIMKNK